MSWLGGLFGSKEAVGNILDKDKGLLVRAGGWFDGLHHTEQEKSEGRQEIREWGIRQLEALAPFKVMQRIMVTVIMVQWFLMGLNLMVAAWVEYLTDKKGIFDALLELAVTPFMWTPVLAAVSLYLMGGVVPGRSK